jgi:hypothetical protein
MTISNSHNSNYSGTAAAQRPAAAGSYLVLLLSKMPGVLLLVLQLQQ